MPNSIFRSRYPDKLFVTFCGRLIDGKGVTDLLNAIAQAKVLNIICLIIGDGPQKAQLSNLSDFLDISDRVKFLGELSWAESISYIKISDIVVNPSYTEGLPTSLIEAALCEKAVIATDVGGTKEIFDGAGRVLLFHPKDTDGLTKHLVTLAGNASLRQKMAQNTAVDVSKKFDWDNSVEKYVAEFEGLALR